MLKPAGLLEACLYARDLDAAENFYRKVLGLEVYSRDPGRDVFFAAVRACSWSSIPARLHEMETRESRDTVPPDPVILPFEWKMKRWRTGRLT